MIHYYEPWFNKSCGLSKEYWWIKNFTATHSYLCMYMLTSNVETDCDPCSILGDCLVTGSWFTLGTLCLTGVKSTLATFLMALAGWCVFEFGATVSISYINEIKKTHYIHS